MTGHRALVPGFALLLLLLPGRIEAGSVTLAWDPNSEPNVAGYVVLYGTQSSAYEHRIDVGHSTAVQVHDLVDGVQYFFAVQAYTTDGLASLPSPEVTSLLCNFTLDPVSSQQGATGGDAAVRVWTEGVCSWTASSHVSWIALTSSGSGSGTGIISYSVAPNDGQDRTGTLTIAGQTVTVQQAGVPAPARCSFTLSSPTRRISWKGGNASVSVWTDATCGWTATSTVGWITITDSAGIGTGSVRFTVERNRSRDSRRGIITIGDQAITVIQNDR